MAILIIGYIIAIMCAYNLHTAYPLIGILNLYIVMYTAYTVLGS